MTRRLIAVAIEPGEDGRCGECVGINTSPGVESARASTCDWSVWTPAAMYSRGPACLAAEKALADVVGALRGFVDNGGPCTGDTCRVCSAKRALAALEAVKRLP